MPEHDRGHTLINFDRIVQMVDRSEATILDIGANNGEHTAEFLRRFPRAQVFSFEPDPRAIEKFYQVVQNPRANLIKKAVGATSGWATFYQSGGKPPNAAEGDWKGGWDLSGSIRRPTGHLEANPWCTFDSSIEVEVTTLDDWTREVGVNSIDFIWADVQGAESDLISGGLEAFKFTRYFYTEYSNKEMYDGEADLNQILAMLPQFEVVEIFDCDVLLRNKMICLSSLRI
jgi:FkbM family methyltransferase